MRIMVLALPAVALLGAGLALRSATQPLGATSNADPARRVAVVDRTPQSGHGYVAPTPRPQLPDLEPDPAPAFETVTFVTGETWNGPPPVLTRSEAPPEELTEFDGPADLRIDLE